MTYHALRRDIRPGRSYRGANGRERVVWRVERNADVVLRVHWWAPGAAAPSRSGGSCTLHTFAQWTRGAA